MTISPAMNLVLPLYRSAEDKDPYAYVHSQPIGLTAFDVHFRLLIRTYEAMIADGASAFSSASRYLKLAAESMVAKGDPAESVYLPLLNEIERLSFAIVGTKTGWDTIPLQQAVSQKLLEPGDDIEAVNSSVFFTAVWHVAAKNKRMGTLEFGMNRSGALTSSLPLMEWIASLPMLTGTVSSDVKAGPDTAAPGTAVVVGQTASLTI